MVSTDPEVCRERCLGRVRAQQISRERMKREHVAVLVGPQYIAQTSLHAISGTLCERQREDMLCCDISSADLVRYPMCNDLHAGANMFRRASSCASRATRSRRGFFQCRARPGRAVSGRDAERRPPVHWSARRSIARARPAAPRPASTRRRRWICRATSPWPSCSSHWGNPSTRGRTPLCAFSRHAATPIGRCYRRSRRNRH